MISRKHDPQEGHFQMNYFITGGLGFVGRHLADFLLREGNRVTATGLNPNPKLIDHGDFRYIPADTAKPGAWQDELRDQQVIINLAGKSIFKRWTEDYKKQIYDSRILTTRNLVDALPEDRQIIFCSTSAVGVYGARGDNVLTEESPPGEDFLANVGKDWEWEALQATKQGRPGGGAPLWNRAGSGRRRDEENDTCFSPALWAGRSAAAGNGFPGFICTICSMPTNS